MKFLVSSRLGTATDDSMLVDASKNKSASGRNKRPKQESAVPKRRVMAKLGLSSSNLASSVVGAPSCLGRASASTIGVGNSGSALGGGLVCPDDSASVVMGVGHSGGESALGALSDVGGGKSNDISEGFQVERILKGWQCKRELKRVPRLSSGFA